MLTTSDIGRAASLLKDVAHFRAGIEDAKTPHYTVSACIGGDIEMDLFGEQADAVRAIVVANLEAKLATAMKSLAVLGVDPDAH